MNRMAFGTRQQGQVRRDKGGTRSANRARYCCGLLFVGAAAVAPIAAFAETPTPTPTLNNAALCHYVTVAPVEDGQAIRSGATWPPAGSVSYVGDRVIETIDSTFAAGAYFLSNYLARYDTGSVLPDDSTIVAAWLSQWVAGASSADGTVLRIRYITDTSPSGLGAEDWSGVPSAGVAAISPDPALTSLVPESLWSFTLTNLSNISLTGSTLFRLLQQRNPTNDPPTGINQVFTVPMEGTNAWQLPVLTLQYCQPAPTATPTPTSCSSQTFGIAAAPDDVVVWEADASGTWPPGGAAHLTRRTPGGSMPPETPPATMPWSSSAAIPPPVRWVSLRSSRTAWWTAVSPSTVSTAQPAWR